MTLQQKLQLKLATNLIEHEEVMKNAENVEFRRFSFLIALSTVVNNQQKQLQRPLR